MTTEKLIRYVRDCGQAIVDNAESIVGNYRGQTEIEILVRIPMEDIPMIQAVSKFIPDALLGPEGGYHFDDIQVTAHD